MHDEPTPGDDMSGGTRLSRDEALVWLNDRVGQSVHASVRLEMGDSQTWVMEAEGPLRNWRDDPRAAEWRGLPRDDIVGWYKVGNASIDLTDLDRFHIRLSENDEIKVTLGDRVVLVVLEQDEPPSRAPG